MESIAPLSLAEDWDNIGLLAGSGDWPATKVLLTIDLTAAVLQEAIDGGIQAIVSYHPPIFQPLSRITDGDARGSILLRALSARIAIYSPHTALDATDGGVNDWLADGVGGGARRALRPWANLPTAEACKLVTFCPQEVAGDVREALSSAGCGHIGGYDQCAFATPGTGTFRGGKGTMPAAGTAEELEEIAEVRLEMVASHAVLPDAIEVLREAHPYEEPPIEVHSLAPRPRRDRGVGRRVVLEASAPLDEVARRLKKHLGIGYVRVAPASGCDARGEITTIGLCAGAGGSLVSTAIDEGCEVYVTGEMRHHDVLAATAGGCAIITTGHTNSERGFLPSLQQQLTEALPGVEVMVSKSDAPPWTYF